MARNTPPTLISYTETASWATTGLTKSTASVSWQTGDVIAVIGLDEGGRTLGTPTATGLTFAVQQSLAGSASVCGSMCAAVVAGSTSSSAVTMTCSFSDSDYGFGVWVWRGSDGIGVSVEQHTATKTKALVPTDTHSAYVWGVADFGSGTVATPTPTDTNTRQAQSIASHYGVYAADLIDQASSASTPFGVSGGSGVGPFSIVALEILGTTSGGGGGTTVKQLAALGVG